MGKPNIATDSKRPLILLVVLTGERRSWLAYFLRTSGIDSIAAHSGREVMMLAERARPDVVLIETGLHLEDGMRTVDVLAALARKASRPPFVVVMESRGRPLTPRQRRLLEVDQYLNEARVTPAEIVEAAQAFAAA